MTSNEKAAVKYQIKKKYLAGEITQDEYDDLLYELDIMAKVGASVQDAKNAMGLYSGGSGKTSGGTKTAPSPSASQTTGMTQEEYNKAKSEMYQKYKAGQITNYAYIQWKKKNDPSKNPAGASSHPMTDKEYADISMMLTSKFTKGEITPTEYDELVHQLNEFKWSKGEKKSAGEVKAALGLTPNTTASTPAAGAAATTAAEAETEKKLTKIYKQAKKEISEKLKEWEDKNAKKVADLWVKMNNGEITKDEYTAAVKKLAFTGDLWKKKLDQVTGTLLDANQQAIQIINDEKMGVFAENANFQSYQLTQDTGMDLSFAIYDKDAVGNLIKNEPELLPRKQVNGVKDKAWNQKKIANAVSQGIIQGESIPQLAARIAGDTASDNMTAMTKYARTAMTSAQNAGRMHTLERAKSMGIGCKKQWLCTLDARTRDAHQELDGQIVDIDQPFQSSLGPIMYPGDPSAEPGNVYNCRCTLIYVYDGYPNDPEFDQRRDQESGEVIQNMTYGQWKAAKEGNQLNDLNQAKVELAQAQKAVVKHKIKEDKVYSDIWKDDVTLADYPAKKGSIAAKRDYYTAEIDKLENAIASGQSWASPEKLKELKKKLKQLNEFELNGSIIEQRDAALAKVQDIYNNVGIQQMVQAPEVMQAAKKAKKAAAAAGGAGGGAAGQTGAGGQTGAKQGQFAADAWDDKTKKAAKDYRNRDIADKAYRKELDDKWGQMTDAEKYSVWEYTHNSNPMNKSLSGYHDSWNRRDFIGYDKTDWGHEDMWRRFGDVPSMEKFGKDGHVQYHKAITDLTKAIDKTGFGEGRWLVRGSDSGGFAGMMEGGGMSFDFVKDLFNGGHDIGEIQKTLVGQLAKNHAFTSTGIADDSGFGGEIKYKIYAPKGTHGIYAEPQSYYGATSNRSLYKAGKAYSSVGHEAEIILQRGTVFQITGIKENRTLYGSKSYEVEMEIVEQPDYFKYGDEDTYNNGQTRHKR